MGRPMKRRIRRLGLLDRFELWCSTSRTIDDLWLGTWDDEPERYLRRVEEALSLIKTYDRLRYDRLTRDLKRIWVRLLTSSIGSFNESSGACQLDARFVLDERSSPDVIASVIVHEATHARLRRCGFGYDEELRPRVEAVCIRREIAFARRLPSGDRVRERAKEKLKWYATPDNLSDEALDQKHIDGSLEALRHLGAPDWLGRAAVPLGRLYLRIKCRSHWLKPGR